MPGDASMDLTSQSDDTNTESSVDLLASVSQMDLSGEKLAEQQEKAEVETETLDLSGPANGPWNSTGLKVKTDENAQVSNIAGNIVFIIYGC